ncbi:MAG: dihydroneopterin aldolase [Bacteroidales bacterium]|nr:dihydroneopterin aldolase [Bacteroidales bacterium]
MGKIVLSSMEFYAFHGCYREERIIGNRFIVDITIETDMTIPSESDNIDDALNYVQVYSMVKEEMDVTSHLLEHLCYRILNRIFIHFLQIQQIEVKVSKFNPPIGGQLESVSVIQQKSR